MVGLSIVLEAQRIERNHHHRHHLPSKQRPQTQILSKAAGIMLKPCLLPFPPPPAPHPPAINFLEACYLCRKQLSLESDIYMYRGDRAFCSEECRCRQMSMDEEEEEEEDIRRERYCFAAAASSSSTTAGHGKGTKSRAVH